MAEDDKYRKLVASFDNYHCRVLSERELRGVKDLQPETYDENYLFQRKIISLGEGATEAQIKNWFNILLNALELENFNGEAFHNLILSLLVSVTYEKRLVSKFKEEMDNKILIATNILPNDNITDKVPNDMVGDDLKFAVLGYTSLILNLKSKKVTIMPEMYQKMLVFLRQTRKNIKLPDVSPKWGRISNIMKNNSDTILSALSWCILLEEEVAFERFKPLLNLTLLQGIRYEGLKFYTSGKDLCHLMQIQTTTLTDLLVTRSTMQACDDFRDFSKFVHEQKNDRWKYARVINPKYFTKMSFSNNNLMCLKFYYGIGYIQKSNLYEVILASRGNRVTRLTINEESHIKHMLNYWQMNCGKFDNSNQVKKDTNLQVNTTGVPKLFFPNKS